MTVKVTKPAVNLREELADLRKPTGIAGEAMLRAETPQEQFNLIGAGRRNWIINGDFQVSQRGDYTSAVAFTNSTYGLDRWKGSLAGLSATMQQKTTDQPNGYVGKSLRVEATSSVIGYMGAVQLIEDYDRLKLREVTVSAYVKASGVDGHVYLYDGGSYIGKGTMVTQGLGWQKVEITGVVKSTATALGIYIVTTTSADASQSHTTGDWIEFTQVQLELGKVATPFEHRSYGEELALCQRYFCKTYSDGTAIGTATSTGAIMSVAYGTISYASAGTWQFPVEMRAAPTVTLYSTANANTTGKVTADSTDGAGVASSISTNSAVIYRGNDSTGVSASVFIKAQATANAEL